MMNLKKLKSESRENFHHFHPVKATTNRNFVINKNDKVKAILLEKVIAVGQVKYFSGNG